MLNTFHYSINNKKLVVVDNIFSLQERVNLFYLIRSENFQLTSQTRFQNTSDVFVRSFTEEDLTKYNFFLEKVLFFCKQFLNIEANLRRFYSNIFTRGVKPQVHMDSNDVDTISLIYHANYEWDFSWGGNNYFLNEVCDDIEKAVIYKPGRLILFDSRIPHCVSPVLENQYRYSLASVYSHGISRTN